jgi:hypothetical protein
LSFPNGAFRGVAQFCKAADAFIAFKAFGNGITTGVSLFPSYSPPLYPSSYIFPSPLPISSVFSPVLLSCIL